MFIDFSESGRETSTWGRNINWLPPICAPTEDQIHNLGTCPDWDLNLEALGAGDNAPAKLPTHPGPLGGF